MSPPTPGEPAAPLTRADRRVLLILRTPPPYGGGEVIGQQLEQLFAERFSVLTFRRSAHDKQRQGRLSFANVTFGVGYVVRSALRILLTRPRVVYVDLPKDRLSFTRTSGILLAALAVRARVVGDLAGAEFEFLRGRGWMRSYARAVLRRLYAIRVLGPSVADGLARHGLRNTVAISNGIADPSGAIQVPRAPGDVVNRFLYVGKIAEAKGIGILIDFVRTFRDHGTPFELEIVGEWESAETESRILKAIAENGIEDIVRFRGLLVGDEKWDCYRRADLLLHPSHWDGQPVTILEALAFGVPVVASRVGAIPDTLSSGIDGYLMEDNTAAELARGVRLILGDRAVYAGFSTAARASYLERFSATVFDVRMADLLRSALSAGEPAHPAPKPAQ